MKLTSYTYLSGLVVYFQDDRYRKSFFSTYLIQFQQSRIRAIGIEREKLLLKEKEEDEKLLYSIFPPAIAKELAGRVNKDKNPDSSRMDNEDILKTGRVAARSHENVSVSF